MTGPVLHVIQVMNTDYRINLTHLLLANGHPNNKMPCDILNTSCNSQDCSQGKHTCEERQWLSWMVAPVSGYSSSNANSTTHQPFYATTARLTAGCTYTYTFRPVCMTAIHCAPHYVHHCNNNLIREVSKFPTPLTINV